MGCYSRAYGDNGILGGEITNNRSYGVNSSHFRAGHDQMDILYISQIVELRHLSLASPSRSNFRPALNIGTDRLVRSKHSTS